MPIAPAKTIQTRANRFAGEYPQELPRFSPEAVNRIPQLIELQERMDKFYFDLRTVLLRNISDLESAIEALATKDQTDASMAEVADSISGQQVELAALLLRLDALESDILGLETTDAGLQSQIGQILLAITILQGQAADASARLDALESLVFTTPPVAFSTKIISANLTVPVSNSAIIADYISILPGITVTLLADATLQIT